MKKNNEKTTPVYIKMDTDIKKRFQKWCIDNETNMSTMVHLILTDFLSKTEK